MKKIIEREALQYNLNVLSIFAGQATEIAPVIKGNAYGHDARHMVRLLNEFGVRRICVYHPEEAIQLAPDYPHIQFLVFGRTPKKYIPIVATYENIDITLVDLDHIKLCADTLENSDDALGVHLKIDTGMHRLGIYPGELPDAMDIIQESERIRLTGCYSHLADGPNLRDTTFSRLQHDRFKSLLGRLPSGLVLHLQNSGGLVSLPQSGYNMARIGMATYGYWPSRSIYEVGEDQPNLRPIMRLTARLVSKRMIEAGERINYGLTIKAESKMVIGIVPTGYSDGLSMSLANKGFVLINGKRTPIIGPVNMNNITVDLSDNPATGINDEVVLIGRQEDQSIDFWDWAQWTGESLYEVMTRIQ